MGNSSESIREPEKSTTLSLIAEPKKIEKRFLEFGRSVKWESTIYEKDQDKISITGNNQENIKKLTDLFKKIDFSKVSIYDVLLKYELINDNKIKKMFKACLKNSVADFKIKRDAINKIKNYQLNYQENGYKEAELKKAIKLLASNKKIDISKSSHLEAVGILYAHLKNGDLQILPDNVSREEVDKVLNKCIKFCEAFELLEVCSAGQEVLTITTKVKFDGLQDVTDMLKFFKNEVENKAETNEERQVQKTIGQINRYAEDPGDGYNLKDAVDRLNSKRSVGFNLMAVGVVYAHLKNPKFLNEYLKNIYLGKVELKEPEELCQALKKCITFLQNQKKIFPAKSKEIDDMLNRFSLNLEGLKLII